MLISAEDRTLISATVFLLANCILLGLCDNIFCGGNHCNTGENLPADANSYISISFMSFNFLE